MSKRERGVIGAATGLVLAMVGAVLAVFLVSAPGSAIPQSNPSFPTVSCGGEWHWVHNQLRGNTSGTLTAEFQNAGTVTIVGVLNPGGATIHYRVTLPAGDTLLSASDTIPVGRLLLSNFPKCATTPPPSTTPPTTTQPTPTTPSQSGG